MKKYVTSAFLALVLSGCAVFKVEIPKTVVSRIDALNAQTSTIQEDEYRYLEGDHCFEPMLYVFTIGLIPTHCVDRYKLKVLKAGEVVQVEEIKVTTMQGWLPLLLIPTSTWKYGYFKPNIESLKNYVDK